MPEYGYLIFTLKHFLLRNSEKSAVNSGGVCSGTVPMQKSGLGMSLTRSQLNGLAEKEWQSITITSPILLNSKPTIWFSFMVWTDKDLSEFGRVREAVTYP